MGAVRSRAGFTLIEIMVVVFILGLLVTLVAPKVMHAGDSAKRTKAAADIKQIDEALHMFKLDNGFYPAAVDGLETLVNPFGKAPNPNREGYLPKLPVDPWGNGYAYFSDGQRFLIKCYGADGHDGGEDLNADITSDDVG